MDKLVEELEGKGGNLAVNSVVLWILVFFSNPLFTTYSSGPWSSCSTLSRFCNYTWLEETATVPVHQEPPYTSANPPAFCPLREASTDSLFLFRRNIPVFGSWFLTIYHFQTPFHLPPSPPPLSPCLSSNLAFLPWRLLLKELRSKHVYPLSK